MVAGVTTKFGPFCSKYFSSGVRSFLERLVIHLSWILEEVDKVTVVLKVLVALDAIFGVVVENLVMRCLSFLIWVFLYCRNVFSLLLKIMFSRSVKVGSSSFCCRDVLVLAISIWMCLNLIFVYLMDCGWVNIQLCLLWPVQTYWLSIQFARFLLLFYLLGIWD